MTSAAVFFPVGVEIRQRLLARFPGPFSCVTHSLRFHVSYVVASVYVSNDGGDINRLKSLPFFAWHTWPSGFLAHAIEAERISWIGSHCCPIGPDAVRGPESGRSPRQGDR